MKVLTAAHHPITRVYGQVATCPYWRRYPNHTGCLVSPGRTGTFKDPIPYVLDNGAFSVWKNGGLFEPLKFMKHLEFYASQVHQPLWVAVPDVVGNSEATSYQWREWFPVIKDFGFKAAFVVQNGHQLHDVPDNADFVFVGGSDCWKWWAVKEFCRLSLAMWGASTAKRFGLPTVPGLNLVTAPAGLEATENSFRFS